jgi:hypothetical protein
MERLNIDDDYPLQARHGQQCLIDKFPAPRRRRQLRHPQTPARIRRRPQRPAQPHLRPAQSRLRERRPHRGRGRTASARKSSDASRAATPWKAITAGGCSPGWNRSSPPSIGPPGGLPLLHLPRPPRRTQGCPRRTTSPTALLELAAQRPARRTRPLCGSQGIPTQLERAGVRPTKPACRSVCDDLHTFLDSPWPKPRLRPTPAARSATARGTAINCRPHAACA